MIRTLLLLSIVFFITGCKSTPSPDPSPALEGWVRLTFDVSKDGNPQNIVVIESHPKGHFDKEAIRALAKYQYKPQLIDGKPAVQKGLEVRLDFKLESDTYN